MSSAHSPAVKPASATCAVFQMDHKEAFIYFRHASKRNYALLLNTTPPPLSDAFSGPWWFVSVLMQNVKIAESILAQPCPTAFLSLTTKKQSVKLSAPFWPPPVTGGSRTVPAWKPSP